VEPYGRYKYTLFMWAVYGVIPVGTQHICQKWIEISLYSKLGKLSTDSVGNIIHEIQKYCPIKKTRSKCHQIIYSANTEFSLQIGNDVHKHWWLGLNGEGGGLMGVAEVQFFLFLVWCDILISVSVIFMKTLLQFCTCFASFLITCWLSSHSFYCYASSPPEKLWLFKIR